MSKPRYKWWRYVRGMVEDYPHLRAQYLDLRNPSITARPGAQSTGNAVSDPTGSAALRELPTTKQREYEAVRRAVETTGRYKTGAAQLKIIQLMYWDKTHRLVGAAGEVGYSYDRAQQLHTQFFRLVASYYGLLDT